MKIISNVCYIFLFSYVLASCNTDHPSGKGTVIEGSNKDDYYQMRGFGDSIPSDSVKEAKRLDSIRISKLKHNN